MRSGNKHIVILTPGFPANEKDDSCIPPLQSLLRQLSSSGLRISVIAFQYPFQRTPYQWHGIRVYPAGGKNRSFPRKLLTWQRCRAHFRSIHQNEKVDLIHSFWMTECAFLGEKLAQRFRIPHLISLMGQDALPTNRYLRLLRKSTSRTIALSRFQADHYRQTTGKMVSDIVHFGIEQSEFPRPNKGDRPIDILGAGSLTALKNYEEFILVVKKLLIAYPQLCAVIAGEGPEQEKLAQLIRQQGLEKHVVLKGKLSRQATLELMQQAKVFLHTSRYESFGYVFPEALMSGCHVVSRAVGIASPSPRWTIGDNVETLAEGVRSALNNKTGIPEIQPPFMSETAKKYRAIYDEAID